MIRIHHLNCGTLHAPPFPPAVCHVLLLEEGDRLVLVDSGVGLEDVARPLARLGQELIDVVGFKLREEETAIRQLEALGLDPARVSDVVVTHADCDHVGGLSDFPDARVLLSEEELAGVQKNHPRYLPVQFEHGPRWQLVRAANARWFGLEARKLDLGLSSEVLLIPLFGHTHGHCGVAIGQGERWVLHVGDAYYLRVELERDDHPVSGLAQARAMNNDLRVQSLASLRRLRREHPDDILMFGYHDPAEMPDGAGPP